MGAVAVAAPTGDQGPPEHAQGNGPPTAPPAQQQQAPAPQGKAKGHAKKASPPGGSGGGQARGHAKSGGGKPDKGTDRSSSGQGNANGHAKGGGKQNGTARGGGGGEHGSDHAKAGKITICHATGSATNPYVEITISMNAWAAHQRHQDGRDMHPVPAGGCPGGDSSSGPGDGGKGKAKKGKKGKKGKEHRKVTICHATGSETNPYVLITIDEHALPAHQAHQHGQDIVEPTGPCPGATIPGGVGNPPTGIVSRGGGELPGAGQLAAGESPAAEAEVLGVSDEGEGAAGAAPDDEQGVLGLNQGSGPEDAAEASAESGGSLPFTGLGLGLLAAVGLVLALAGMRLRRSTT
jgi:hypothetical protein